MSLSKILLSILVVNHNTRLLTLACLRSIFCEAHDQSFEVIVVDNASSDGSAESIEADFPAVHLIKSKINIGFARANNLAATHASGRYLLLLNPDTLIVDHAIDRLLKFAMERPTALIWGGRTLFGDGVLNPSSCWRFMSLWSLFCQATGLSVVGKNSKRFNTEGYGGWKRDSVREVDMVTGCFLLIDQPLWVALQGFDASLFMYAEDADLCFRARKLGGHPIITPDATIVHYGGASETVMSQKMIKLLSAKAHFLRKHWSQPRQYLGLQFLKLMALTRFLGYFALAKLHKRSTYEAAAKHWQVVWAVRNLWAQGFITAAYSPDNR